MPLNISTPPGSYYRVPCALVIEDAPTNIQGRLNFETFPEVIEEVYALTAYREIGGDGMSQPGGVAYRGGNWSTFGLSLEFRAGERQSTFQASRPSNDLTRERLEQELQDMEKKARWCQALGFPLPRELGATFLGSLSAGRSGGVLGVLRRGLLALKTAGIERRDPPRVLVVFGSWMTVRTYVENVSVKWMAPWDPQTGRPYGCQVSMSLKPLLVERPTWDSVSKGPWAQSSGGGFDATPTAPGVG